MAVQIQFRRDTGANWSSASTVLAAGEMGIDLTEDKFKIGDGTTAWDDLDYAADFTGVTATAEELNFVDGVTSAIQTQLNNKAPLASPTFTGTPTLPTGTIATTQTAGESSTAVATTAFVGTAVSNLVDSAPATLNTLNELADALGDDPSFATTVSTNIGLKAPLASPTFTGTVTIPTGALITAPTGLVKGDVGLGSVDNTADTAKPVSTAQQTALDLKAPLASPTFTGTVTVPTPVNNTDAVTKAYVDGEVAGATINSLDEIGDVTITSASAGDFLKFNGSAFVNDAINLGTDTVGSFVESLTAGTGITLTNNSGEAATPTIAIGQAVGTSASVSFAQVTADLVGNSSTATLLQTARNIAGQSFDGSANISIAPTDLTGVTSTAEELNILDGATLTVTELNYVDGVTSAIQTQIDTKAAISGQTFTGAINTPNNTASMIPFYYADVASFPSANDSHGALAHSHATGLMYYAHAGNWIELANLASPTFTGTPTLPTGTIATTQTALNSTTAVATTAFVTSAVAAVSVDFSSDQNILANAVFG